MKYIQLERLTKWNKNAYKKVILIFILFYFHIKLYLGLLLIHLRNNIKNQ